MSTINVVRKLEDIPDREGLIQLMIHQLESYGAEGDKERLSHALENALKEESRAVFFLWEDHKFRLGAFAFANICSGLESGGDYLWINELYVDVPFRKRGVAQEILKFIDQWAVDEHLVYIACSTGQKNVPAQNLYAKQGFSISSTLWVDKEIP